jgi:RNA polymerase sigma-70 factor, ECF subfamily
LGSTLRHLSDFYRLDAQAQRDVYSNYCQFAFPIIYSCLRDYAASEDVLQEAFLKTIDRMPPFPEEARIRAWVRTTTRRCTVSYLRKNARARCLSSSDIAAAIEAASPSSSERNEVADEVELKLLLEQVHEQLKRFKPETRAVMELRWKHELSYSEIAERICLPENTVRSKLHRAREWMKRHVFCHW